MFMQLLIFSVYIVHTHGEENVSEGGGGAAAAEDDADNDDRGKGDDDADDGDVADHCDDDIFWRQ